MIVVWRVTERCSLACPFCAHDRSLGGPRAEVDGAEALRFGRILADWSRRHDRDALLSWLGGEPLLWPPLWAVAAELRELGLRQSATTSGVTLAALAVRQHILDQFDELTVSVDTLGVAHERLRGWPGGWVKLREGVTALATARGQRQRPLLRANIVVMRDNRPQFADLCLTLAMWGFDEITFNALGGRDRPEFFPDHGLTPADVDALAAAIPPLRLQLAGLGVRLCGGDDYLRRIAASARGHRLAVIDCRPGEDYLFIDERGRIAACPFTVDARSPTLAAIESADDLDALPETIRTAGSRPACADCPSTRVFAKFER